MVETSFNGRFKLHVFFDFLDMDDNKISNPG